MYQPLSPNMNEIRGRGEDLWAYTQAYKGLLNKI